MCSSSERVSLISVWLPTPWSSYVGLNIPFFRMLMLRRSWRTLADALRKY